jgi:hypothetical protein
MPTTMRYAAAAAVATVLVALALTLHANPAYGRDFSFTVAAGAAFGFVLQRSRCCFASAFRDLFLLRDRRMALGTLAALAVGCVGYVVVFGAWVPDPSAGWFPQKAHVAPANWHLLLGGCSFGAGMALAGGCVSGNLYRLGEGSLTAPVALAGAVIGYWGGFALWNFLWVHSVSKGPTVWLPQWLGYSGALALQLGLFAILAGLLLKFLPALPPRQLEPADLNVAWRRTFEQGWPHWVGGAAVGVIATLALLRTSPLGVTSEIGRLARRLGLGLGIVPQRLEGLDGMAGCRPILSNAPLTENGTFVVALALGSFVAALMADEFRLRFGRPRGYLLALAGGVLLGFGAMISMGCTVGTMLSGIMAFSLSGWIFVIGLLAGAWAGGKALRRLV